MIQLLNAAAEQSVIGCCIQGRVLADEVDGLRPEHFAIEAHAAAFGAILHAWSKGVPVDAVSLDDVLPAGAGKAAGLSYWIECADAGYSTAMLRSHAASVREKAARRALAAAADEIAQIAHGDGAATDLIATASSVIGRLSDGGTGNGPALLRDILRDHIGAMQERWDGKDAGLKTGLTDLDARLRGLRPGNLVLVGARPAMGKSALAMGLALHAAQTGAVAVFSQEMSSAELADRAVASVGRVPLERVIEGGMTDDDFARMTAGMGKLNGLNVWIDDAPAQRVGDIRAKVMRLRRKHPIALVVVDYLQLMTGDGDSRNGQVEQISRGMKALAKELECPVVALSQLSRKCEERPNKRPIPADLRDSGAIEQDADVIMFIYRDEVYNPDSPDKGTAEIIIAKNRQGRTGVVRVTWLGEYTTFADCAYQESQAGEVPTRRVRGFGA